MLGMVEELGESIRKAFHWVPADHPIHIFMDNAGGHGTKQIKLQYMDILKHHFKVEVVWQVSCSPETNILDLGVWCTVQSLVEYIHRWKKIEEDALAYSIEQAWTLVDGYTKFHAVNERWKKVLNLILLGKGGNTLVEKCRGLRGSLIDDVMVLLVDDVRVDKQELEQDGMDDGYVSDLAQDNDECDEE